MKIEDRLDTYTKSKLDRMRKKKTEKVNWKEIMGVTRDRYERRGGAIRRK
ncbi:MAG: hypothetical protein LPK26_17420 [Bacillaceae bacterium]|nr:hypothetical protein [Bacillaceae bacterium]